MNSETYIEVMLKEYDRLLNSFNIQRRAPTAYEVEVEGAVKSFIRNALKEQTAVVHAETLEGQLAEASKKIKSLTLPIRKEEKDYQIFYRGAYNEALGDVLSLLSKS